MADIITLAPADKDPQKHNFAIRQLAERVAQMASTPFSVANGGTGTTSFPSHGVLVGSGTSALTTVSGTTTGQLLVWSTTSNPSFQTVTTTPGAGSITASTLASSALGYQSGMVNGTIVETHGSSAATFAVKTLAAVDPSSSDPVLFVFRDATAAIGDYVVRSVTSALSLTLSNGSKLGTANSTAFKIWLAAFDNGGTVQIAAMNCVSATDVFALGQFPIASANNEGGAGAANSAQVFYSSSTVASKPYLPIAYAAYESGLATAGAWSASPTRLQLFGPSVPLPAMILQSVASQDSNSATGTTTLPYDDTIPQITEGTQFMSKAITPSSASNILEIEHSSFIGCSAQDLITCAIFQDSTTNAIAATVSDSGRAANLDCIMSVGTRIAAGVAGGTSTTIKIRIGTNSASTVTFNGSSGARKFGGVAASYLRIKEIMT
jgi:hypothetical protein